MMFTISYGYPGSSDATLKLWKGKTCIQTFVGHTGLLVYCLSYTLFVVLTYVIIFCLCTIMKARRDLFSICALKWKPGSML